MPATLEILKSPVLAGLTHGFFTRHGGASSGIYHGLNCGHGSQDQREAVALNRTRVAEAMGVPLARIYEVLTFYHYFKLTPPGRAVISVCMGTACYLKGAPGITSEIEKELGIKTGESTADGMFHIQSVRCIGCCGLAPVITVNEKTYGRLKVEDIKGIIAEWRKKFAEEDAAHAAN